MKKVNIVNKQLITRFSLGGESFRLAMRCTVVRSIICNTCCLVETRIYFTTTSCSRTRAKVTEIQQVKQSHAEYMKFSKVMSGIWNTNIAGRILHPECCLNEFLTTEHHSRVISTPASY
jgi:hypothetical protein